MKDRKLEMHEIYWLDKGFTKEEAKQKVKNRQTTFSKEICIQKYGEIEGIKRWNLRQKRWLKNYKFNNYSQVSQVLFKQVFDKIKYDFLDIHFATRLDNGKNNEYRLQLDDKIILPDFFVKELNKIIEFDGVYWHRRNPENKKRELSRDKSIKNNGYKVLHINEDNFKDNPDKEINRCIDFIYKK